jgi:glycine cleavage system H protein
MSRVPDGLWYTSDHEWVRFEDDDFARVGITDYAQGELGDIVFVEAPDVGRFVLAGERAGTIEAVKAVAELVAPVSGVVTAVNNAIGREPGLVNSDPYGAGWLFTVQLPVSGVPTELLSASAYLGRIGAR